MQEPITPAAAASSSSSSTPGAASAATSAATSSSGGSAATSSAPAPAVDPELSSEKPAHLTLAEVDVPMDDSESLTKNGWHLQTTKDGVEIWRNYRDHSIPIPQIMGRAHLTGVTAQEVYEEVAGADPDIGAFDPMFREARVLKHIDANHEIVYMRFHASVFVADREFVYLESRERGANGTIYIHGHSVDHPYTKHHGAVLGQMYHSGWIIRPLPDNNSCDLIVVFQISPEGWIPHWVVNLITGDEPMVLRRLEKVLQKRKQQGLPRKHTPCPLP